MRIARSIIHRNACRMLPGDELVIAPSTLGPPSLPQLKHGHTNIAKDDSTRYQNIVLLWRLGGFSRRCFSNSQYTSISVGRHCIFRDISRWKRIARRIYEYKSELGEVNCSRDKKWWIKYRGGSPTPLMARGRNPSPGYKRPRPQTIRLGGPVLARVEMKHYETVGSKSLQEWLSVFDKKNVRCYAYYVTEFWVTRSVYRRLAQLARTLVEP